MRRKPQPYRWPDGKKCAVAISFDFDAETPFLWRNRDEQWKGIGEFEQRKMGPRQSIYRILDLLNKWDITATFFIPGYVAEQYPEAVLEIHRKNHEIGLHGYVHERVDEITKAEIDLTITKSKEILKDITGIEITGYRSPSWELTEDTISVLKERNISYDSSLMGYDHPYWMNGIPELPVQWLLDDAIYYRYTGGLNRIPPSNPTNVIDIWKQEFLGIKQFGGLFMLTMHPWISGRGSRIMALDGLLHFLKQDQDIWWASCQELADYHKEIHSEYFHAQTPDVKQLNEI